MKSQNEVTRWGIEHGLTNEQIRERLRELYLLRDETDDAMLTTLIEKERARYHIELRSLESVIQNTTKADPLPHLTMVKILAELRKGIDSGEIELLPYQRKLWDSIAMPPRSAVEFVKGKVRRGETLNELEDSLRRAVLQSVNGDFCNQAISHLAHSHAGSLSAFTSEPWGREHEHSLASYWSKEEKERIWRETGARPMAHKNWWEEEGNWTASSSRLEFRTCFDPPPQPKLNAAEKETQALCALYNNQITERIRKEMEKFLQRLIARFGLSEAQVSEIQLIIAHVDWANRLLILLLAERMVVTNEAGEPSPEPAITAADLGY